MAPQEDEARIEIDTVSETVARHSNWLALKLNLGYRKPLRRLAWPTCEMFLPLQLPEELPDNLAEIDWADRSSDSLRLCFASDWTPGSYYPDMSIKGLLAEKMGLSAASASFAEDLRQFHWPLYSLGELAAVTEGFIDYLLMNASHIEATGYPHTVFSGSKWFHSALSTLYYTRIPVYVLNHLDGPDGSSSYTYLWPVDVGKSLLVVDHASSLHSAFGTGPCFWYGLDWRAYTNDGTLVSCAPYGHSALLEGLSTADALQMEQIRGKLLRKRINVLEELASAAWKGNAQGLREKCLGILTTGVSAHEADLFARVEAFYMKRIRVGYTSPYTSLVNGSFVWNLLMLIGHYEEEIECGRLAQSRALIGDLITLDDTGNPRCEIGHYRDIIGRPEQALVDAATGLFHQKESDEKRFWQDFHPWIGQAWGEFPGTYRGYQMRRKHIQDFGKFLDSNAQIALASLELGGQLPQVSVGVHLGGLGPDSRPALAAGPENATDNCRFQRQGHHWSVSYDGKTAVLKDSVGLRHIRFLLQNSGKEFSALQLHCPELLESAGEDTYSAMSENQLEDEDLHIVGSADAGEIMDDAYEADCRKRLKEAIAQLNDAKIRRDEKAVRAAQQEVDAYRRVLNEGIGLSGRHRKALDDNESARSSVSKAIKRAYEEIRQTHPPLYEHLRSRITRGSILSYDAADAPTWSF